MVHWQQKASWVHDSAVIYKATHWSSVEKQLICFNWCSLTSFLANLFQISLVSSYRATLWRQRMWVNEMGTWLTALGAIIHKNQPDTKKQPKSKCTCYTRRVLFWSGRKPGGKITRTEQKQSLFKLVPLDGSGPPDFYFFFKSFLFPKLHTKKFLRRKMLLATHVNILNIFTQKDDARLLVLQAWTHNAN